MTLPSEQELNEVLGWLGFSLHDFSTVGHGARSLEEANHRLDRLRQRVRRASKCLWLELHPDRSGDKSTVDRLSRLSRVIGALDRLEVHRSSPAPKPPVDRVPMQPFAGFAETTADWWGTPTDWPWG